MWHVVIHLAKQLDHRFSPDAFMYLSSCRYIFNSTCAARGMRRTVTPELDQSRIKVLGTNPVQNLDRACILNRQQWPEIPPS